MRRKGMRGGGMKWLMALAAFPPAGCYDYDMLLPGTTTVDEQMRVKCMLESSGYHKVTFFHAGDHKSIHVTAERKTR